MTKVDRKRSLQTATLGLLITSFFVANPGGWLDPVENWLYDLRARECQYFSAPPTDRLVHLDIDDRTLDVMGAWPWRRSVLAQIIDEVHDAGAEAMALDIIFLEPQPGEDEKFADAIQRFGHVLIPAHLDPNPKPLPSPIYVASRHALETDLELPPAVLHEKLRSQGIDPGPLNAEFDATVIQARREAMFNALDRLVRGGVDDPQKLQARLIPHDDPDTETPLRRLLLKQLEEVRALRELDRFTRPVPQGVIPAPPVNDPQLTVRTLAHAAGASGFVDFIQHRDGVLRDIPLWTEYRGRLYPQMGMVLACMMLHADPREIQIENDHITIVGQGGERRIIPSMMLPVGRDNEYFGHFMPIPWFGRPGLGNYATMYDYPQHVNIRQHVPVVQIFDLSETRKKLIKNNDIADDALTYFYNALLGNFEKELADFQKNKPGPQDWTARQSRLEVLAKSPPLLEQVQLITADQTAGKKLSDDDREFLTRFRIVQTVLKAAPGLAADYAKQQKKLRADLSGKAVLMGWTATGAIADFVPTSVDPKAPGVIAHGAVFNAIMTGDVWRSPPPWVLPILTLVMGLIATAAVTYLSPVTATFVSLSVGVGYALVNGLLLFDYGNLIVGMAAPLLATGSVWSLCVAQRYLVERRERARILARFQTYVDPELVSFVQEHPELATFTGATREMTVVFTDLAGFTTISEKLQERVVPLLNRYMGIMVPLIRANRGYVNKFLGDGIMFFFGAPRENVNHARDSVAAVLQMQQAMIPFNQQLVADGLPEIHMRVGITTGNMIVGDAGPPGISSDYTVLGDIVNTAARFESANKATGTLILIHERTAELIGSQFLLRPVAQLQVVGKSEFVMVYEPLAPMDQATDEQKKLAESTKKMVDAYIAGDFAKCIEEADFIEGFFGVSKLPTLYRKLSKRYLETPPEHFEGGISLTEK